MASGPGGHCSPSSRSERAGSGRPSVVLDTNASLEAAGNLYRRAGYVDVAPYNDNPNATNWYAKRL